MGEPQNGVLEGCETGSVDVRIMEGFHIVSEAKPLDPELVAVIPAPTAHFAAGEVVLCCVLWRLRGRKGERLTGGLAKTACSVQPPAAKAWCLPLVK